ncbi:8425_t:CDS:2, partial [Cetraspora pellucida]
RKLEEKAKSSNNSRLITVNYNACQAASEYDFINSTFYSTEEDCNSRSYVVCLSEFREKILELMQKHFDMHLLIPIDAQGNTMEPEAIKKKNAIEEMYKFCAKHRLREWTYVGANDEEREKLRGNKRKRSIDIGESNSSYFTEVARWVCSCHTFVKNHFFLCKHLVRQTVNTSNKKRRRLLRCRFEHHTTPPFLTLIDPDTSDTTSLKTAQIVEAHADGFSDSYNVNADEDPDKEAHTYVESNWELFKQAFRRICSEKAANNWRHIGAMMK